MVDLKTVMNLPDKDAILQWVVRKEVNELLYDRPTEWFGYLEDRAKLIARQRERSIEPHYRSESVARRACS